MARTRRRSTARRCKHGVSKKTGRCLKHKRARKLGSLGRMSSRRRRRSRR